jgi:hypothetical protein
VPRGNPQRGDFTGKETQRLQREKLDELQQRQQEIGLATEVDIVVEHEGIFDPATGQLLEMSPEGESKVEALNQPIPVEEADPVYEIGEGPKPLGSVVSDPSMQHKPKRSASTTKLTEVEDLGDEPILVEEEYRTIRVNTDIEDMTYGVGNTFSMVRGKRYRVQREIAQHLESKGLVFH